MPDEGGKRSNMNVGMEVISHKDGLDYAVDYAEQSGKSVLLEGAPMTMRYGANPHYVCSPDRMVMPVAIDGYSGKATPLQQAEYHCKI